MTNTTRIPNAVESKCVQSFKGEELNHILDWAESCGFMNDPFQQVVVKWRELQSVH